MWIEPRNTGGMTSKHQDEHNNHAMWNGVKLQEETPVQGRSPTRKNARNSTDFSSKSWDMNKTSKMNK